MLITKKSRKNLPLSAVALISILCALSTAPVTVHAEAEEEGGHIIPHEIGKLEISGGITSILQGTSGISDSLGGDVTDFTYTLDLNFEAAVSPTGKVVIALEAGNGNGVNDNTPSMSISNYDAYVTEVGSIVTPSVSQAYFEGSFVDGLLGLQAGKLDVHSLYDENTYANDETDQFISGIFTRYPGSIFPELDSYYAPGVAITLSPSEMFDLRLIGANGVDSGFENITENGYLVGHVNIKPGLLGREGNYRFHYIYDARNYRDIASGETDKKNTAFGLSFDQEVADGVGLFVRYAIQDDGVEAWSDNGDSVVDADEISNPVKSAISGGVSLSGSLWGREQDVVGAAYGVLVNNEDSTYFTAIANPGDESHAEVYYKFGISDHITITPDLQLVTNAGGDADNDPITVYGVRAQMNF